MPSKLLSMWPIIVRLTQPNDSDSALSSVHKSAMPFLEAYEKRYKFSTVRTAKIHFLIYANIISSQLRAKGLSSNNTSSSTTQGNTQHFRKIGGQYPIQVLKPRYKKPWPTAPTQLAGVLSQFAMRLPMGTSSTRFAQQTATVAQSVQHD